MMAWLLIVGRDADCHCPNNGLDHEKGQDKSGPDKLTAAFEMLVGLVHDGRAGDC